MPEVRKGGEVHDAYSPKYERVSAYKKHVRSPSIAESFISSQETRWNKAAVSTEYSPTNTFRVYKMGLHYAHVAYRYRVGVSPLISSRVLTLSIVIPPDRARITLRVYLWFRGSGVRKHLRPCGGGSDHRAGATAGPNMWQHLRRRPMRHREVSSPHNPKATCPRGLAVFIHQPVVQLQGSVLSPLVLFFLVNLFFDGQVTH